MTQTQTEDAVVQTAKSSTAPAGAAGRTAAEAAGRTAAVILAAGGSTRFGEPKQLLDWDGRPLITHIADTAWAAGLDPVIVVIGAHAAQAGRALASRPVQVVHNYRWEEGMSSSLYTGVAAIPQDVDAAVFIPVDQPLITPQVLQALVQCDRDLAHMQGQAGTNIIISRDAQGRRGLPVLFGRRYFAELARLSGDVGGRVLFERHPDHVTYVPVADAGVLTDVDTPETYQQLQALRGADGAGPRALDFGRIRGLICDMDGVLWRGTTPLPGLHSFFELLAELDLAHVLVTNNSSRTPADYVSKLAGMGVSSTPDHVLNSAIAAARYVADTQPGATVYAIGGPGVKHALETHGLVCHTADDTREADVVVVGWDLQLTWRKLATATRLILDGATFVGTNPDLTYPLEDALAPGNGAQLAALEAATGVAPVIAGKPARLLYEQAMARMQTTPETTLVIGDRLDTDILGGIRLGMPTALVLTGISQPHELRTSPIRPTVVLDDLPHLVRAWRTSVTERQADNA